MGTPMKLCVIESNKELGKIKCKDVYGLTDVYVSALEDGMGTFQDIMNSAYSQKYPWNFDYWKYDSSSRDFKYQKSKPYINLKEEADIPLSGIRNWIDLKKRISDNLTTLVIDLKNNSVTHLNYGSSPESSVFPRSLTKDILNDPNLEKAIKRCEREEERRTREGEAIDLRCGDLRMANKDIPDGFEPVDLDFSRENPKNLYAPLLDMLKICNPQGYFYESLGNCLQSRLKKEYR